MLKGKRGETGQPEPRDSPAARSGIGADGADGLFQHDDTNLRHGMTCRGNVTKSTSVKNNGGKGSSLPASQRLDTTTLFGRFRVDPVTGVQTGHQIRVVQWRDGQRGLVDRPPRRK